MPERRPDPRMQDPDYVRALAELNRSYPGVRVDLPAGIMRKRPIRDALRYLTNQAVGAIVPALATKPALTSEQQIQAQADNYARLQAAVNQGSSFGGWGRSSGAKFTGGLSKPIGGRITNHWGLRQQARDIVEDSVHAYTAVHRKADMVIDQGLTINPAPIASVLGISPEEADAWAQKVAVAFEMWSSSKTSHRSGMFNFKQAMHQLMVGKTRDNDEFMRLYYSQRSDLLSPLQWEIIDANQIRGDAITATNLMPLRFFDGIDRNADGSERAYRIWIQPPEGNILEERTVTRVGEKSGRVMMLHGFQPEYSGQGRGYSQMGVNVQEFELAEDYVLSIIKKAINQSQMNMAVEPSPENPASNPWESLGMPPAGPSPIGVTMGGPGAGGIVISGGTDGGPGTTFVGMEEATFGVPGSVAITNLAEGEKIKMLENTVPGTDFEPFMDWYISSIIGPFGLSLDIFKIKFADSFSAARGALAVVYRFLMMERTWLDAWCLAVVYRMFLSCEIAAGRISCPGWQDPRVQEAWCAHTFIGSPPVQIDPTKETAAAKDKLEMSVTTLKAVTHEIGTGDIASNVAANTRDFPVLPIPPWEQKISVAATTMAESEAKQDKQTADAAKAAAKAPAPAGPPKPVQRAAEDIALEAGRHAELLAELRMTRAMGARTEKRQEAIEAQMDFGFTRMGDRLTAVETRPIPETPQPITLETHIHNDGKTVTTREIKEVKRGADLELIGAKIVETTERVPEGANGKGK